MLRTTCILKVIFILAWASCQRQSAISATIASQTNGNWSNSVTWGGGSPQAGDHVIIKANHSVNLNQTTASSIASLTIQNGAKLIVTVNGSAIHLSQNIINDGELTTWVNNGLKGTLFLHGNSYWSGSGIWNLGAISLNDFNWEFEDNLSFNIAGNISGTPPPPHLTPTIGEAILCLYLMDRRVLFSRLMAPGIFIPPWLLINQISKQWR
ncbi:hypothetical protein GZH53_04340 [Flavihumibacter sp. R14]|nr:hypothetical protein [Flavihumibacter soli]